MKKKIVIFLSQPIDKRNIKRLGFYQLKKDFDYEIWDLSLLFNKRTKIFQDAKNYNKKNFILIKKFLEFFKKIKKLKNFYFIDLTTYSSFFFSLFQIFAILKGGTKISFTGVNVPQSAFFTKKEKLINFIKDKKYYLIFLRCLLFAKKKIINFFLPNPQIAFVCGNRDPKRSINKASIVESQCLDYDFYLLAKKKNKIFFKDYIVFLDNAWGVHPELVIYGNECSKEKHTVYLNELKNFLEKISKHYKKKIIFAVHPRADYKYINLLKNTLSNNIFFIVKKNIAKFISSSYFVIAHNSSSHQIAVLNYKFILFCYGSNFSPFEKNYIDIIAKILGTKSVNMSDEFVSCKILVNKNKYYNYISDYVTKNSNSNISSWQIVCNFLKKYEQSLSIL